MSTPPQLEAVRCPECGAENVRGAQRCFLCYRSLNPYADSQTAPASYAGPPIPKNKHAETSYIVLTVLTLGLLAMVGVGLFANEASLGIGFAVLCAPAIIATGVSALQSNAREGSVSWVRAFNTLIFSGAITFAVIVGLFVAAIIALFVICIGAMTR